MADCVFLRIVKLHLKWMHQIEVYQLCFIVMPLSQIITLDVLYHREETKMRILSVIYRENWQVVGVTHRGPDVITLLLITDFDILATTEAKTSAL